jgi:hypothetical protein
LLRSSPGAGEIRDEVKVRNLAAHFARLDERGELTYLFDLPAEITDEDRRIVEPEEGWILGVR